MNKRIEKLTELTLSGKMFPHPTETEYDRTDLFLPKSEMESKRTAEYILNQNPVLNEYCTFTGLLSFDGSCVGDSFNMYGHEEIGKTMCHFYQKPIDNISVMEWQHATGEYNDVLKKGIKGLISDIENSERKHTKKDELDFLKGLKTVANAVVGWAEKCSSIVDDFAKTVENTEYKQNLITLANTLKKVPANPAENFYEALLSIYVCYSFNPDSFGTLDRYLEPYYEKDINSGKLTREKAKEYLQEFLLEPQARNTPGAHWTKGGQSHFCVGGYREDGEDGFGEISKLIVEALMELPTYIPEITCRWTKKMSHEDFYCLMDFERKDKNKRLAFTNDEKRLKGLTEICKIPYEKAIRYTLVGCNEIAFPGSVCASTSKGNILRCIDTLFHKKSGLIENAECFDDFYRIFEEELKNDLDIIYDYDDKYNLLRSNDYSYISALFFNDCIENAKGHNQGGGNTAVSSIMMLGLVNVIDSLIVVNQFVFEEKIITMHELCNALKANWCGYEDLRLKITETANYFGNNDEASNRVTNMLFESLYTHLKDKRTVFNYPVVLGDHTGYSTLFEAFGKTTNATPDGRFAGEPIKYGFSQSGGYDRNGLTSLLTSVATADPNAILSGSTVTNITVEDSLITDDHAFELLVLTLETYFEIGGTQFQLNYASLEDLLAAKKKPEDYKNLRVRVTGFSEFFVNLEESVQDSIIERTARK